MSRAALFGGPHALPAGRAEVGPNSRLLFAVAPKPIGAGQFDGALRALRTPRDDNYPNLQFTLAQISSSFGGWEEGYPLSLWRRRDDTFPNLQFLLASTGGNVTVSLGGQRITATEGAIGRALAYSLTGQAVTSHEGTLARAVTYGLTGQITTSHEGTLARALTYGLTGQAITSHEGTITASTGGNVTVSLAGQAITSAHGTLLPGLAASLSGQHVTSSEGVLARQVAISLSGQQITSAEGAITAHASGNVTIALTGLRAVFAHGQIIVSGQDVIALAETPAGRKTRVRERYIVRIDSQEFTCRTLQEALDLLAKAREAAKLFALEHAPKVIRGDFPHLELPRIKVDSRDLRRAVSETKREIASTYRDAMLNAELGVLFEIQRSRDEDESILLLM